MTQIDTGAIFHHCLFGQMFVCILLISSGACCMLIKGEKRRDVLFFVVRREQKRGYCIMFSLSLRRYVCVYVCGSSFCCAIFSSETPLWSLSNFRGVGGIARAHTHSQRRSPVRRKFSRGKQTHAGNARRKFNLSLLLYFYLSNDAHTLIAATPPAV